MTLCQERHIGGLAAPNAGCKERGTISMSDEFADEFSAFMKSAGYFNRSEALRDLARLGLQHARINAERSGECCATLSYVFNVTVPNKALPFREDGCGHRRQAGPPFAPPPPAAQEVSVLKRFS